MTNYILRRLFYGVLVLLGVNLFTFILFFAVNTPDDMARLNIGGKRQSQEQIDKWKVERGYNKPLWVNSAAEGSKKLTDTIFYERSVSLLTWNFGRSDAKQSMDINHEIGQRMLVSLQLALPIFILQVIVSVCFAVLLAFFRAGPIDFWGSVTCIVIMSISAFFYILLGQFFFSKEWRLVPISGFAPGLDVVKFLVLPVLLSLVVRLGAESRLYRAMLLEEATKDYVRTARAKGLSETIVLFRHVLRNAALPILTSAGGFLPVVFMGSLVFESMFAIPGLGSFTIDAITGQDFAIVRSMVFVGSVIYILSYILIDVLYTVVDPRVRLG
jgi:peptide/nickel transport system permease protein